MWVIIWNINVYFKFCIVDICKYIHSITYYGVFICLTNEIKSSHNTLYIFTTFTRLHHALNYIVLFTHIINGYLKFQENSSLLCYTKSRVHTISTCQNDFFKY